MLSAFEAEPIIELKSRDKSKIESILLHGDQLLVGFNTGVLRIYRIHGPLPKPNDAFDRPEQVEPLHKPAELLREYEKFSKNKIAQLAVFKEANTLIALSGGLVSIHDLGSFETQDTLTKSKGASSFAATSNIVNDAASGVPCLVSRLAVAVKRRLLLWSWHDGELGGEVQEIALANGIKSLTWATATKLVVGLSSQYVFVDIESQDVKSIIGPGSIGGSSDQENSRLGGVGSGTMSYLGMGGMVPLPMATGLGENEMLLARDTNTQFIDRNGEPVRRRQVPWKTGPLAIGYSYPFLLSLRDSKGVMEVRNPHTLTLLQSIELPGATFLQVPNPSISLAHQGKGFLVASDRTIWRMKGSNYDAQINVLVESGFFDEAISLLGMIEETLIDNSRERLREIKMLKAQSLFDQKQFPKALEIFSEVLAPPERVIKLYPEVISGPLAGASDVGLGPTSSVKGRNRSGSISSTKRPKNIDTASIRSRRHEKNDLSDKDLKEAVHELQKFLADTRRRLRGLFDAHQHAKTARELEHDEQKEENLQVIESLMGIEDIHDPSLPGRLTETAILVDTTLFRIYTFATPSLVGSLFRMANFCDPEVVMSKLEANERHGDLIDFLYGKKLHRQALERLQKLGESEHTESIDPQLRGPQRTVTYLQNLSADSIDLIIEFARWPLGTKPDLGIEIFTADTKNAEELPRAKVLTFLESIDKKIALQYLEHIIDEWGDDTPDLHQKILVLYLEKIKQSSGSAKEDLVNRFLTMLTTSNQYSPAKILELLPPDDPTFYESTAIIFNKMGQRRQALQVYVFKLRDLAKAEEYCNEVYIQEQTENARKQSDMRRRTSTLTKDPTDEQSSIYHVLLNLYLNPPSNEKVEIGPAIELMAKHGPRLPASSTLEMIPNDLLVKELEFYLRGRMRHATTGMNDSKVVAGLRKVEAVRVSTALILGEGDASLHPNRGRQRRVQVDEDRVCRVCFKRLGLSVISVFPDDSVVHLNCATRRQNELNAYG